jgi:hypothetical protein
MIATATRAIISGRRVGLALGPADGDVLFPNMALSALRERLGSEVSLPGERVSLPACHLRSAPRCSAASPTVAQVEQSRALFDGDGVRGLVGKNGSLSFSSLAKMSPRTRCSFE